MKFLDTLKESSTVKDRADDNKIGNPKVCLFNNGQFKDIKFARLIHAI